MPNKPIARPQSKPDAAVERLVRKWWKDLPKAYDSSVDKRIKRAWLLEIIIEARQSAARECAEIAPTEHGTEAELFRQRIREHFGLEGK